MKTFTYCTVLVLTFAAVMPAVAQDRVGPGGLPGVALDPFATADQCDSFDVTLTPFQTSMGYTFGVTPLVQSSKSSVDFYNSLISAQSISRLHKIDGDNNQFGVVFAEFGGSFNGIVGALVDFYPDNPTALSVTRAVAAMNGQNANQSNASFGIGSVDADGNILFRADDYQANGPNPVAGSNIVHVDMESRNCGALNIVSSLGLSDAGAGQFVLSNQGSAHGVPNIGPEALFGSIPHYMGANFDGQLRYGPVSGSIGATTNHRTGTSDHRGAVAYMTRNVPCVAGSNGIAGVLSKSLAGGGATESISIWAVAPDGGAVNGTQTLLTLPATVTDNGTGEVKDNAANENEFDHYHSQTAFRGGVSQVALGVDQAGRLLASAVVYEFGASYDNPINYIAIARVDCDNSLTEWTIVAYTSGGPFADPALSKRIYDADGEEIGRIAEMYEVTGGSPNGPSMSAPMIDSVGNVWFISAVELYKVDQQGVPFSDFDSALIRGIYDPTTFSYELELVMELGQVFLGQESGFEYQIGFMGIADSDSISSGTAFSSNISELAYDGLPAGSDWDTADPRALGGLIVNVDINYDNNGEGGLPDGFFNDPTSSNYDASKPADDSYQVALYIGYVGEETEPCPFDLDGNGAVGPGDVGVVKNSFGCDINLPECAALDFDDNGAVGPGDVGAVKNEFGPCP